MSYDRQKMYLLFFLINFKNVLNYYIYQISKHNKYLLFILDYRCFDNLTMTEAGVSLTTLVYASASLANDMATVPLCLSVVITSCEPSIMMWCLREMAVPFLPLIFAISA